MFEYTLKFRTAHANADALSRLPLAVEAAVTNTPPELVLLTEHLANSPVSAGHHIGPNIAVSRTGLARQGVSTVHTENRTLTL